jgi:hypothetical protein
LLDNVALILIRGLLHVPTGLLAGDNTSTQTMVLAEQDAWRITAFHNTFVRETPPQAPAIDGA